MKPEDTIDHPIRWAWHKILRHYNNAAAEYGSSMSVGYALLNVSPEGTPSTKLGPKMGMEARSLTRTLRNMEEQGLITRERHESDGRMMLVKLTADGKKMRDVSKQAVIDFNEVIRSHIPQDELQQFHRVMGKINDLLDNDEFFK